MPLYNTLWYTSPGQIALRPTDIPTPGQGEIMVRALYSGVSRGTERLVMEGRVPESEYARMRCPMQEGDFSFPVKYGYALVATVAADAAPDLRGRTVFLLHPHQEAAVVPATWVRPLPDGLPPRRACLAANMETALNITWDAELSPGQKILVVGGGVLGMLTAALATQIPNTVVTVADVRTDRAAVARQMGAQFALPDDAPGDQDIVIHTSATDAGLNLALARGGFEAKIIEASWFGARPVAVALGEGFHAKRLHLISSQVGAVAPSRRTHVSHAQRLQMALDLLQDAKFDALITGEIAFTDAPKQLPDRLTGDSSGFMTVLRYP